MKVHALIASNNGNSVLVKIFRNESDANEVKVALNNLYDKMEALDEQESNEKYQYWETHKHMNSNRVMDNYYKQESYTIFVKAKEMAHKVLMECGAPLVTSDCFVETHDLE